MAEVTWAGIRLTTMVITQAGVSHGNQFIIQCATGGFINVTSLIFNVLRITVIRMHTIIIIAHSRLIKKTQVLPESDIITCLQT